MPFQYTTPDNRFAGTIGSLIARQGEIQAQAAREAAAARAQAAQQTGQIWQSAVQGVGQNLAGAIQHQQDPQTQLAKLQLGEAQRANASRAALEAELLNPANRTAEGQVDSEKVYQRLLPKAPELAAQWRATSIANQKNALEFQKTIGDLQKNDLDIAAKQQQAREAQSQYLGKLAYNALGVLQSKGGDVGHAIDAVVSHVGRAAADGAITREQANQFILKAVQSKPEDLANVLTAFVPPDLKAKLDKEAADLAKEQAETERLKNPPPKWTQPQAGMSDGQPVMATRNENDPTGQLVRADTHAPLTNFVPRPTQFQGNPNEPLTPEAIDLAAMRVHLLGTASIPTRISGDDRVKILNREGKISKELGQSPAVAVMKQLAAKADSASLNRTQILADASRAAQAKAEPVADLIVQLSEKVDRTQFPIINQALVRGEAKVLGDANATNLLNALTEFTAEYAKVVEGSANSSSGATQGARQAASELVTAAMNKGTLKAQIAQMKQIMDFTIKGYDATIENIQDRIISRGGVVPPKPETPPAPAPAPPPAALPPGIAARLGRGGG